MRAPMHWRPTCAATWRTNRCSPGPTARRTGCASCCAVTASRSVRGAAVAFALLAGAALALWQAHEARLQRDAALQAQAQAEHAERVATAESELSGFLLMEMSAGSDALAAQLERARQMFDAQYRNDPALRGRLLVHLGGLLNGRGDVARAQALWAEAEPLLREHGEWSALAELKCFRARDLARDGQVEKARAAIAEAVQWLNRSDAAATAPARRDCLASEGVVERVAGNTARAVVLLEHAVAGEQRAGRAEQGTFVELLNVLARTYFDAARYRDAVQTARRASALVGQLGLDHTTHASTARGLQALALRDGGRPLDALTLQRRPRAARPACPNAFSTRTRCCSSGGSTASRRCSTSWSPRAARSARTPNARCACCRREALTDLGRLPEAGAALADAEALFAPLRADKRYAAHRLLLVQAHWALAAGDLARAQGAIDEAGSVVAATGQARRSCMAQDPSTASARASRERSRRRRAEGRRRRAGLVATPGDRCGRQPARGR